MKVIIVIPVYKAPNEDEIISLRRCCQVLSRHKISLVCPEGLDTSSFHTLWEELRLQLYEERFNPCYFKDIAGYNRLLLSECFYARFSDYDYILIYQPDAYVFKDELIEWCEKGYDYIGAPLVGEFRENEFRPNMSMRVGNGGFSLRRISSFLNFFSKNSNVFSPKQICNRISLWKKPYTRVFVWVFMMFGWHNKPRAVAAHWKYNEDDFWSGLLNNSKYKLNIPFTQEALRFAFERFPKELYEITKELPFGCHAWKKYEFDEFWSKLIK